MSLNLEKQLQQYGAYHHNAVNVGIHMIFVPAILFTALMLATNSPNLDIPKALSIPNLPVNLGTVIAFAYASLYILMEPVAGALVAPLIMGGVAWGNHLVDKHGMTANYAAIVVQIFSWIFQFVGHGVFEGRAPALLDNLVQAFFLAPFFVWFELLFWLGYRPELKARLDIAIEQKIKEFRASKAKTANGSANGKTH